MQSRNPAFHFLLTATRNPNRLAIRAEDYSLSYGHLAEITKNMARHMAQNGAGRGSTVSVSSDDLVVVLSSLLAVGLIGATWMIDKGSANDRNLAGVKLHLNAHSDPERRQAGSVLVDESWARRPQGQNEISFSGYSDPEDIFVISRTSGTTGTPKLVALSYRAIQGRNELNQERWNFAEKKITGLFPISAPALVSRYLSVLVAGGEIVSSPDPAFWREADVDLVFGSPNQFSNLLDGVRLPKKLARAHLSGSSAPTRMIRALLENFEVVANGYGSTEGFNCLATEYSLDPDGEIQSSTAGLAAKLQIVDDKDNAVAIGAEGIVRIHNNVLASGYLGAPQLTDEVFRNGWFYPGDLGRWTEKGILEITGRVNDQFNLGGKKVAAALIDQAIQSVEGVRDAVSFMMPRPEDSPRLTAFISLARGAFQDEVLSSVKIELLRRGGIAIVPEKFLVVDQPPRTPTGKPDRETCVDLVNRARMLRSSNASMGE